MEDLSEIMTSKVTKDIIIEFKSKEYKFKLRNLSWSEKNKIISRCIVLTGKTITTDLDTYYRLALQEMIVEAPWPIVQTAIHLKGLDEKFGQALQKFVPAPLEEDIEDNLEIILEVNLEVHIEANFKVINFNLEGYS